MRIYVGKGLYTDIDDEDKQLVSSFPWHTRDHGNTYYAVSRPIIGNKKRILHLHHLLVGYPIFNYVVDHIDGNGLNNKRSNLRIITQRQNMQNLHIDKSCVLPGVSKKACGTYRTYIKINGKSNYLGTYRTEEKAFDAYRAAVTRNGESVIERSDN